MFDTLKNKDYTAQVTLKIILRIEWVNLSDWNLLLKTHAFVMSGFPSFLSQKYRIRQLY